MNPPYSQSVWLYGQPTSHEISHSRWMLQVIWLVLTNKKSVLIQSEVVLPRIWNDKICLLHWLGFKLGLNEAA